MRKQFIESLKREPVVHLRMDSAHAIIAPNIPSGVNAEKLSNFLAEKTDKASMESFGLFGGEAQYTHFDPTVTPESWTPKEEDYIYPMFRLLSMGKVVKFGIPIDFSKEGVLKTSMEKAKGITVYPDHKNDEVGNALGTVYDLVWQEGYKADGVNVPAGINGVLKIDAKSNPRLARSIMSDPPAIHSGSITVAFAWEKSHDIEDFWDKVGSYDDKGNLIRVIAKDIKFYKEYSLVSQGADPYAQKIENERINNPKFASAVYPFSFHQDFKNPVTFDEELELSFDFTNPNPENTMNVLSDLMEALKADFPGLQELSQNPETTVEELGNALRAEFSTFKQDSEALAQLRAITPDITPETLTALNDVTPISEDQEATLAFVEEMGGKDNLELFAKEGKKTLDRIRTNAISHYKLTAKDKASEKIIQNIEKADLETAMAFEQTYTAQFEEMVPLSCKECGSTQVSRASSEAPDVELKIQSLREEAENLRNQGIRKPSDIHK